MARTSVVWMVHARTGLNGLKGTLALDEGRLVFTPESTRAGQSEFDLGEISRVRRVRGSPVMEIYPTGQGQPPVVGFYFVKPPSLTERYDDMNFVQRRTARKKAMNALRGANRHKKREVEGWVEAIRAGPG